MQSSVFQCQHTLSVVAVTAAVVPTVVAGSAVAGSMEAVEAFTAEASTVGAALAAGFTEVDSADTTAADFHREDFLVADTEAVRSEDFGVGHPVDIEVDMDTAALADSEEAAAPSAECAADLAWGVPVTVPGAQKGEGFEIRLQDGTPSGEARM